MNYYDEKHYIIAVDEEDSVIGKVERWEAHENGILHRAFTVGLKFEDSWVIQHRKHPVFNSVFDVTCSSHPLFTENNSQQEMDDAVIATVSREWDFGDGHFDKSALQHCGKVYYKAQDTLSKYQEHEVCHVYTIVLNNIPRINSEFAYGMSLVPKETLFDSRNPLQTAFAPWVKPMLTLLEQA